MYKNDLGFVVKTIVLWGVGIVGLMSLVALKKETLRALSLPNKEFLGNEMGMITCSSKLLEQGIELLRRTANTWHTFTHSFSASCKVSFGLLNAGTMIGLVSAHAANTYKHHQQKQRDLEELKGSESFKHWLNYFGENVQKSVMEIDRLNDRISSNIDELVGIWIELDPKIHLVIDSYFELE